MISTHALREEGDLSWMLKKQYTRISTHALREEGDAIAVCFAHFRTISTHALREEGDADSIPPTLPPPISTHALREEGDVDDLVHAGTHDGFLPTPSARRATSAGCCSSRDLYRFLPTPSARRATFLVGCRAGSGGISTHALREEGDAVLILYHKNA